MLPKTSLTLALALVLASATSAAAASAPAACTIEVIQPRITTAIVATMPLRVQWMVTPTNASAQLPNDATVAVELMRYGLVVANKPLGRPQSFATIAGNASVPALPVLTDQPMTTVYETQAKMPKFQNWMSNNAAYFVRFVVSAPRAEVDAWRGVNASSNADAGAYAPVELCSADSSRFMIMSKARGAQMGFDAPPTMPTEPKDPFFGEPTVVGTGVFVEAPELFPDTPAAAMRAAPLDVMSGSAVAAAAAVLVSLLM